MDENIGSKYDTNTDSNTDANTDANMRPYDGAMMGNGRKYASPWRRWLYDTNAYLRPFSVAPG